MSHAGREGSGKMEEVGKREWGRSESEEEEAKGRTTARRERRRTNE